MPCACPQQQQLGNLSHLFDDVDKVSSDISECPETPLPLFPVTPTSDMLVHPHFSQVLPEAPTPPLVSIVPLLCSHHMPENLCTKRGSAGHVGCEPCPKHGQEVVPDKEPSLAETASPVSCGAAVQ